ncbi:MAG TPA: rhomboid family intramembrane serine protease [Chloroflexota bacterium]|nr:rhomboid family intramembrane serine protease [Chloroflexota bacterium]
MAIPLNAIDTDDADDIFPWANIGLIVVNFLVFFYELSLSGGPLNRFFLDYSLVPCEYTSRCVAYAGTPHPFWVTLFTSMFIHAGWAHILGNMLFLFIFGNHIERSMGHWRYVGFYFLCGLGASVLEIATAFGSHVPGLGASGAIAGVLAGFLVLYPTARIGSIIPLGFLFVPVRLPAWVFIGLWFLYQLWNGAAALSSTGSQAAGGVAYWAHVGGFITGLLLVRLFSTSDRVEHVKASHQLSLASG